MFSEIPLGLRFEYIIVCKIYYISIFAFLCFVYNRINVFCNLVSLGSIIHANASSSEYIWTGLTFWNTVYAVLTLLLKLNVLRKQVLLLSSMHEMFGFCAVFFFSNASEKSTFGRPACDFGELFETSEKIMFCVATFKIRCQTDFLFYCIFGIVIRIRS